MSSRRSSGSRRAESAVEPTISQNITVSWRRSASVKSGPRSARARTALGFNISVRLIATQAPFRRSSASSSGRLVSSATFPQSKGWLNWRRCSPPLRPLSRTSPSSPSCFRCPHCPAAGSRRGSRSAASDHGLRKRMGSSAGRSRLAGPTARISKLRLGLRRDILCAALDEILARIVVAPVPSTLARAWHHNVRF
jgi:hypothetical protein